MSERWSWLHDSPGRPWCIAHRGASDFAFDNSLEAFELAHDAGADFWEVDVRSAKDGGLVIFHDPTLKKLGAPEMSISNLSCDEFQSACSVMGQPMPRLEQVIELAVQTGTGLYIDAKDQNALEQVAPLMARHGVGRGIITSFNRSALAKLARKDCVYPRSVLVRRGADPIQCVLEARAQLIHLCWEWADCPVEQSVSGHLLERSERLGVRIVCWHEERSSTLEQLLSLGVRGICTNHPALLQKVRQSGCAR